MRKGDRKGQYRSNKKNVSKGVVLEMEALIGGALVTEMGGMLEHAGIEAQAACRQQRGGGAPVSQHLRPEPRLGRSMHQRSPQEGIPPPVNGMAEDEAGAAAAAPGHPGGPASKPPAVE